MDRWSIKSHLAFSLDSRLGDNNCDPWIFQKSLEIEGAAFVSDSEGRKRETECPIPLAQALHDRCPLSASKPIEKG